MPDDRETIIVKRLIGDYKGLTPAKDVCDCDIPTPYRPKGVCAPMFPINHCLFCGGFVNDS